MKKSIVIFISTIALLMTVTPSAFAANPTPTTSSSMNEKLDQQINQLKEKIASRVSELNLVEKRGIIGVVSEVKTNQITVTDMAGNVRFADVDEITKFSSAGSKNFGISDLTKGTKITILGIYNKQSKRILARFVETYASPTVYSGTISAIAAKAFQVTIVTSDQKQMVIDVDTSTKITSFDGSDGLSKYGFSKLAVGDRISVVGKPSKTDANLFSASRIIDYIGAPKDPNAAGITPAVSQSATTPTAVPTAAGTKKLNQIR